MILKNFQWFYEELKGIEAALRLAGREQQSRHAELHCSSEILQPSNFLPRLE